MAIKYDSNEILESKITIHDKHRFEVKLDIDLPESDVSTYQVEAYFFIPKALNIAPTTYSKNDFYKSIQKYIRFKTPQMALEKICDPQVSESPINRIRHNLKQISSGEPAPNLTEATFQEIKLLGAIIRVAIRDKIRDLLKDLASVTTNPGITHLSTIKQATSSFLAQCQELAKHLKNLELELAQPEIPAKLKEAFRFLDEFYSLNMEDYLAVLLHSLRNKPQCLTDEIDATITKMLTNEQAHRSQRGYPSLVSNADNSVIPYRKGVLKKFVSSALHLNLEPSEWEAVSQLNFSMAAGIAMFFAAVITGFAQAKYATNSSMFITILVVTYILRDRMKDWLKATISKKTMRWLVDKKVNIQDPLNKAELGYFKEAFSFVDYNDVPDAVMRLRNMDNITSIDEEGKPERIIKYEKKVLLHPHRITASHQRRRDINDIMRFNVSQWLRQADDPKIEYLHFEQETNTLEHIYLNKVYHINLVLEYQTANQKGQIKHHFERIRLVLNREGIVHLEEVGA